jgi:hypothetical protein
MLFPVLLAACGGGSGGDDDTTPDAPAEKDFGFKKPDASVKGNMEVADNEFMELGPADLSCLNTPNGDLPTTVAVELSTIVRDFQSDNLVPNAGIEVFNADTLAVFDNKTSAKDATVTIDIPVGVKRFGYRMTDEDSLETLLLNQKVKPDMATQTEGSIRTVSKATAATMPALIGIARTQGTGVLAGAMRDCQDHEVSNFVAAVVSTRGATEGTYEEILAQVKSSKIEGSDTYYFRTVADSSLPVKHTQESNGTGDGLFMVVELAVAPTAIVQIWGYANDNDFASDKLTLLGELETESKADTVITGSYEPRRN